MSFQTYNRDIPDAPNNPSNDQPLMKTNTNAIDTLIGQDHVSFNTNYGGFHKDTHIISRTGNPASVATVPRNGIIYTKEYTPDTTAPSAPDTQLYFQTALGGPSQLTGNFASTDGWCWMGGMLIQWGQVTFAPGSAHVVTTVTFKSRAASMIPFPNNCFVVNATLKIASTLTLVPENTIAIRDFSATQFRAVFNNVASTGSTLYPGFYWIAIGN